MRLHKLAQLPQPIRLQCLFEVLNQVVVLAEIVLQQRCGHLLRQGRSRPLGAAGHLPQVGAGLVKQRQLALVAAVTAIAHGFGQIQEPPQQLQR